MSEIALPYVLVAEKSLLPIIPTVVESLQRHGLPKSIEIVVPGTQVSDFQRALGSDCKVTAEESVLPEWTIGRIRAALPNYPFRAGWYLQQFLKLSYGEWSKSPHYVIWDADTVMLRQPTYRRNGRVLFNVSREYHQPYFRTFEKLFGATAPLKQSVISQYMFIDSKQCLELRRTIEERHGVHWIEAVLAQLPAQDASEFSEFETYANYLAMTNPASVELCNLPWFRYGSEVMDPKRPIHLNKVERAFRAYHFVAFERHPPNRIRKIAAHALRLFGSGS